MNKGDWVVVCSTRRTKYVNRVGLVESEDSFGVTVRLGIETVVFDIHELTAIATPLGIATHFRMKDQHSCFDEEICIVASRYYDHRMEEWCYSAYQEDYPKDGQEEVYLGVMALTIGEAPIRFKKGDIVKITDKSNHYWNCTAKVVDVCCDNGWQYQINDVVMSTPEWHGQKDLKLIKTKSKTKESKMSKTQDQVTANKESAILAAKLVAGKTINKKLMKLIRPKLPMFMKGYADSAFASLVAANAVGVALKHYAPTNPKAMQIAEMMLDAAALEALESFNIEELLEDLLKGIKLPEEKKQKKK